MTFSVTGVVVHTVPDHASHVPSEFFHVAVSPVYSSLLSIPQVVSSSTDPSLCTLLSPPPVLIPLGSIPRSLLRSRMGIRC
jgi:hypothetical protein